MGKQFLDNRILSGIWYFKVFVALGISIGGLALLSTMVYEERQIALNRALNTSIPIRIDPNDESCQADRSVLARLEPNDGEILIGFHIDWMQIQPEPLAAEIQRNPAIINAFLDLNDAIEPPIDWDMLRWHGSEVQKVGGIFELTMQPNAGIANVSDATLRRLAEECRTINEKGVPIYLRYGHEMNGDWTTYGLKPFDYVTGYRKMAGFIREYTNLTALVWSPNIGINYPFRGGGQPYPTNVTDPVNFQLMDTNNDGVLNAFDDPYEPYFPGPEYVDWYGISLYWYPDENFNTAVWPNYFRDNLVGRGPSIERINVDALNDGGLRDFYGRYPARYGKPLMIPETAAPWFAPGPGVTTTETELEIKRTWWRQIYNLDTFAQFPWLKAVVHFEERKRDGSGEIRDWRLLENEDVRLAFLEDIALFPNLLWAQQLQFGCGGQIEIEK